MVASKGSYGDRPLPLEKNVERSPGQWANEQTLVGKKRAWRRLETIQFPITI